MGIIQYFNLFERCPRCSSTEIHYSSYECWCSNCGRVEFLQVKYLLEPEEQKFYTRDPLFIELNILCNQLILPDFLRRDIFFIAGQIEVPEDRDFRFLAGCILIWICKHYRILTRKLFRRICFFCKIRHPKKTLVELEKKNKFKWTFPQKYCDLFMRRMNDQEKQKKKIRKRQIIRVG